MAENATIRGSVRGRKRVIASQLQEYFNQNPRIAVAFSGGVDSSYLLYAAKAAGVDVHAYFIKSEFQPEFELREAAQMAESLNASLTVEDFSVLSHDDVVGNTIERCYLCKTKILERLWTLARADGYDVLCDGTNADDDEKDRPGMIALREHGVASPLRLCNLSKADIRRLSKQAGLFTHDKPAYACLATRIPTGTPIQKSFLEMVEHSESALFEMGFSDFRVRLIPPNTAKIQMPAAQWEKAAKLRAEIKDALSFQFEDVVLDLATRG